MVWVGPIVMTMKVGVHNRGFPGMRIRLRLGVRITQRWVGQGGFSRYNDEEEVTDYTMVGWSRWRRSVT